MIRRSFLAKSLAALGALFVCPLIPANIPLKYWTWELAPDIVSQGALDIEASLIAEMSRQMQIEIDGEILTELNKYALCAYQQSPITI